MLTEAERKKLTEKLTDYNRDISEIRKELNILNDQKEGEFSKRATVGKEISSLIRNIKSLKKERDKLTSLVRKHKEARKKARDSLKKNIDAFKAKKDSKREFMNKHNLKVGPEKIKEQIDALEMKIETEAIPFKEEKKIMKQINAKKKLLKGAEEFGEVFKDSRTLSKDINKFKKEVEDNHNKIQNFAKQSQGKHEAMIKLSDKVDELKKTENKHMDKFKKFKEDFVKVNEKLKKKLPGLNDLREKLDLHKREVKQKKKKSVEKRMKDKEMAVEEKIKKRKKLTTEDLLVFQQTQVKK